MSDTDRTRSDPAGQLFDELERVRAGMLGVRGSHQHMQPMSHFLDRDTRTLWFITASDTDLVQAVGAGSEAHYCVVGKDHDYHACLQGGLEISHDEAKLDELWNRVVAAWFEGGREDARVTLLRMPLAEAAVWSSTGNGLAFAWEIARANMDAEHLPDIGEHTVIDFRHPA